MIKLTDKPGFGMVAHLIDLMIFAFSVMYRTIKTSYNGAVTSDTNAA
jgi:hypothetical protein